MSGTSGVTGYRKLSDAEIALINEIKAVEAHVAALLKRVRDTVGTGEPQRQAAIARTELEGAFMRLSRSVAQPISPWEQ